ncbi:hypothetical protein AAJP47_05035 [Psychrobacter sp. B38]|uniref:hypothetical protein n=1 Tax=Psychrobacter sp. B38 TaxID=3143538 RepID=UPI00320C5FAD
MLSINHQTVSLASKGVRALLLSAALVVITANSALAKNSDLPIRFAKGAISSTTTGKLSPNEDERWYHFQAEGSQYAVINILPLAGTAETANAGILHMPNGTQDGSKGGIVYQGCLPETGEYRFRIARNLMATRGKIAGYQIESVILPKYASESLCK